MKKDNTIFWIIGIIVFILLVATQTNLFKKQETGMIGLNVHYYNDGKEVFPTKGLFSIVTPPGGSYNQIAFSISGTAQGVSYSNIKITSASPSAFFTALPTTTQALAIGETKTLWSSELMSTAQFESMSQPVKFWVNISAKNDYTGLTVYQTSYIDLEIKPPSIWIYQENPNDVLIIGNWYKSNGINLYDGNWNTYDGDFGDFNNPSFFYLNYTKPSNSFGAKWSSKVGGYGILPNITILQSCWNYNPSKIILMAESNNNYSSGKIYNMDSYWNCFDGNWKKISKSNDVIYEEGIWWQK